MKTVIFLLALFSCSCAFAQNSNLQLQPVLTGLSSPLLVTNAHDGSNRIFIIERGGLIKVLQPESTTTTVFLNISTKIVAGGEQGLLGLTFHPNFKMNRRFFVNYTRVGDGATIVAEYKASVTNRNIADTAEKILLTIAQPFSNHNGGMIEFGADGFLYIGMGDGGSGNDPGNRAQNNNELLGKMLRIDVDSTMGALAYGIPADNPLAGAIAGADEIYATGVRNPWRYSFDRLTGQLYVGDVGQNAKEWVHVVERGKNYGWATWEGTRCNAQKPTGAPECAALTPITPLLEYDHAAGRCSITGGYVYRGARFTFPYGAYLYGDYCTGEIWQNVNGQSSLLLDTSYSISSFGEDEGGEIYLCDLSSGAVYRFLKTDAPKPLGTVNAASYDREVELAPEGLAATFGSGLANGIFQANTAQLPTNLGGTSVTIRDSKNVERLASLFYVGPTQINFALPAGTAKGYGAIIVKLNDTVVSSGAIKVDSFAPALFSANQDGIGPAIALLQNINNGVVTYSSVLAEKDPADFSGVRWRTIPIDLAQNPGTNYLLLYATGVRGRANPLQATTTIGGTSFPVEYAGDQQFFVGLDQVNILLNPTLQGKGEVDLVLTINEKTANTVRVRFK